MDANQLAGQVKEGTAGISANQRTFRNKEALLSVRAQSSHADGRAAFRVKSLGMAQSHHKIPHMKTVGFPQFHMRILSSVHDLHHGGIPREVGAQHPSLYHTPVGKDHTHDFIAAHDVGRRQNQALRRDNDAAARLSPVGNQSHRSSRNPGGHLMHMFLQIRHGRNIPRKARPP